jgi:undecaprenyl diphosphate synthase
MGSPEHVAIIMDGNGRWAEKRNLPRVMGHRAGVKTVEAMVETCAKKGIKTLTLYTFSAENWKRPAEEIDALMALLERNLREQTAKLKENNIRLNFIGRIDDLPHSLRDEMRRAEKETAGGTGMALILALNYGGRQEILDAAKKLCEKAKNAGTDIESFREEDLGGLMYTSGMPDPDLIIRTSGEMRVSNFLLWQGAYSEFYVTDTLWPDFNDAELEKAFEEYSKRERRFGG